MKLTDTEWTVMHVVWERSRATARDVLESVEPETSWAYTTVKTILTRLVEKGALRVEKRANTSVYEPVVSRGQARRSAVVSLVERAFDGTFGSLLQHLVSEQKLNERDREELGRMLERLERPNDVGDTTEPEERTDP